jgi:hypothetical protein
LAHIRCRLHGAEGDFTTSIVADDDCRSAAQVEIVAIPNIGLNDPPAANEFATCGRPHVGAAISFGSRTRL